MTKERELLHRAYAHIGHALPEKLQKEIKAALAQPEPEPVTWRKINGNDYVYCDDMTDFPTHEDFGWQPLYTHPQPERPPLTEDELRKCFTDTNDVESLVDGWDGLEWFARAIEKAHGIKETKCK
jgi:hypothetical protein